MDIYDLTDEPSCYSTHTECPSCRSTGYDQRGVGDCPKCHGYGYSYCELCLPFAAKVHARYQAMDGLPSEVRVKQFRDELMGIVKPNSDKD